MTPLVYLIMSYYIAFDTFSPGGYWMQSMYETTPDYDDSGGKIAVALGSPHRGMDIFSLARVSYPFTSMMSNTFGAPIPYTPSRQPSAAAFSFANPNIWRPNRDRLDVTVSNRLEHPVSIMHFGMVLRRYSPNYLNAFRLVRVDASGTEVHLTSDHGIAKGFDGAMYYVPVQAGATVPARVGNTDGTQKFRIVLTCSEDDPANEYCLHEMSRGSSRQTVVDNIIFHFDNIAPPALPELPVADPVFHFDGCYALPEVPKPCPVCHSDYAYVTNEGCRCVNDVSHMTLLPSPEETCNATRVYMAE